MKINVINSLSVHHNTVSFEEVNTDFLTPEEMNRYINIKTKKDIEFKSLYLLPGCNVSATDIKNKLKYKISKKREGSTAIINTSQLLDGKLLEVRTLDSMNLTGKQFLYLGYNVVNAEETNLNLPCYYDTSVYIHHFIHRHPNLDIKTERNKYLIYKSDLLQLDKPFDAYSQDILTNEITSNNPVIDKEKRIQLEYMILSFENKNIELACDIIGCCDVQKSFVELLILFTRNRNRTFNYRNKAFRSIMSFFNIKKVEELSIENCFQILKDKNMLTQNIVRYVIEEVENLSIKVEDTDEMEINDHEQLNF